MDIRDILERLARLPRTQRLVLIGAVYLLAVVLWWFLVYSPGRAQVADLRRDLAENEEKRETVRARAENREAFEKELEELASQLKSALSELPDDREIPDLLRRISSAGQRVGLEVNKFAPLPEVVKDYYAEVPVALEVTGAFHEVALFFDKLSKLSRIVNVRDVNLSAPKSVGTKVNLTVTGTAVTYRFLSEEELQKRQADKDKKKKK